MSYSSAIYVTNRNQLSVKAGETVPFTRFQRRIGTAIDLGHGEIVLLEDGFFDISGSVTIQPYSQGKVGFALLENGSAVPGATITCIAPSKESPVTIPFRALVRKKTMDISRLSVRVLSDGTITNLEAVVTRDDR